MASLLPAVHGGAPILAMSGGGDSTATQAPTMSGGGDSTATQAPTMSGGSMSLLPHAPSVPIAGMHGGASLLPPAPDVPMIAMRGGADLYPVPSEYIHNISNSAVDVASFGIVNTFSETERFVPEILPCTALSETSTALCTPLQPFMDRRVQALLKRVGFPSGDTSFDMGCGTIARKGTTLTIVFHHKGITLLSSDLTGTFAAFHKGVPPYKPSPVAGVAGTHGLLSWMLGSPVTDAAVTDTNVFDLITFMEQINGNHTLPLEGFRTFLSYHKEGVKEEDVLRYAMELYGYRTGDVTNTNDIYGLILPPHTAVRRTGATFDVYVNGVVTQGIWDPAWTSQGGFAVYAPAS